MELRDFIVTPIVIILVYWVAYWVRPHISDGINRKYFFPALTVRIVGALAVGFIYQFYYGGGDTFGYHTHGSRIVWEAFIESPLNGLKLLFANGDLEGSTYRYASRIWFYEDPSSYFVVRVAAIFDLFTFSTYSGTAILFAVLSFSGVWALFEVFYSILPQRAKLIAISVLFVPSVFFWGSGILKDSLTLAGVGWATYCVYNIFVVRRVNLLNVSALLLSCLMLYFVKLYILLCFLPAVILWVFLSKLKSIRSVVLRILIAPLMLIICIFSGYWAVLKIGEGDKKYSLDKLAETARVTAYDIGFYTGRSAGSKYSLGELDGTLGGMLSKAPEAINVSLFRPYLWEANNVFMLISAVESFVILLITLYVIVRGGVRLISQSINPVVLFCFVYSITFAFAVGISTYNFGTLVRYKIPLIPFYLVGLILLYHFSNNVKKLDTLEATE